MIKIKDIIWKKLESSFLDTYHYEALIRDCQLLWVVEDKKYTTNEDVNGMPILVSRYHIHTLSSIFRVKGNEGIEEWGWFDDLEECKLKAEEVIKEEILSFIDIRDYKIEEVLK